MTKMSNKIATIVKFFGEDFFAKKDIKVLKGENYDLKSLLLLIADDDVAAINGIGLVKDTVSALSNIEINLTTLQEKLRSSGVEPIEAVNTFKAVEAALKKRQERESKETTMAQVLRRRFFGPPFTPYEFGPFIPDSQQESTESIYTKKPKNGLVVMTWPEFDHQLQEFMSSQDELLMAKCTMPYRRPSIKLSNEATMTGFIYATVLDFWNDKFEISIGRCLLYGRPDITYWVDNEASVLFVNKHIGSFTCQSADEILRRFTNQVSHGKSKQPDGSVRPINQIISYLILNKVRYAILSNLDQNYAFERFQDDNGDIVIHVAPMKPNVYLLKVLAFLLHRSLTTTTKEPVVAMGDLDADYEPNDDEDKGDDNQRDDKSVHSEPDDQDNSTKARQSERLKDKPTKCHGQYFKQCDELSNHVTFDEQVHQKFQSWDFELVVPTKVLGYGRAGYVTLGKAWQVENPASKVRVAVKMADFTKKPALRKEMQSEARLLVYANNRGLKCVPKLIWSGYFGFGGEFYVNCTEQIAGVKRDLDKLSSRQRNMLREALEELQSANIFHRDINKDNIIYGKDRCYIIDFGCAQLFKRDTYDELEFDEYTIKPD